MKSKLPMVLWFLCSLCAAESRVAEGEANRGASAHLRFRIVVPPVFRVLQVTPVGAEDEYRVWTNMRSIVLNGTPLQFQHVGETVLRLPRAQGALIVHGL